MVVTTRGAPADNGRDNIQLRRDRRRQGARPHRARTVGGQAYSYDANDNLQSGDGRTYAWNADNQPTRITGSDNVPEDYAYDADDTRVSHKRGNVTTIYLGGLVEQEGTTTRTLYLIGGQVVAQREGNTVIYLHGDHLGSISVATSSTGVVVSKQEFTPWGEVRSGGIGRTTLNYTGQRKDGTGLLFPKARYYDPGLARLQSIEGTITAGLRTRGQEDLSRLDQDNLRKLAEVVAVEGEEMGDIVRQHHRHQPRIMDPSSDDTVPAHKGTPMDEDLRRVVEQRELCQQAERVPVAGIARL